MSSKSGADSRAVLASGGESACAKARRHQADSIVHVFALGAVRWLRCGGRQPLPGRRATPRTRKSRRLLRLVRQGRELGSYEGEESPVEDRGLEPNKCSRSKRASLDSIAASRAFSLLSCSISLSSCYGFAGLRLHPQLVLHLPLLDAGIPSPVERLQPQAPLRQRCTRSPIAGGVGRRLRGRRCGHRKRAGR
jgi:hypothetical protein